MPLSTQNDKASVTITRPISLRLPQPVNYLSVVDEEPSRVALTIDVADLSDDDLRAIGAAWTEQLLAHAAKRRSEPKVYDASVLREARR